MNEISVTCFYRIVVLGFWHWRTLVKNIGGANPNLGEEMW